MLAGQKASCITENLCEKYFCTLDRRLFSLQYELTFPAHIKPSRLKLPLSICFYLFLIFNCFFFKKKYILSYLERKKGKKKEKKKGGGKNKKEQENWKEEIDIDTILGA
jgi:hypothetical protein